MSCRFFFDRRQRVLLARFGRRVTREALADLNAAVRGFVAAEGPCRGIVDFSAVEEVLIESHDVAELGRQRAIMPGQQHAIVAPRDEAFGLSRMFGLHRSGAGNEPIVVRSFAAACALFGLDDPQFAPIDLGGPPGERAADKPAR